MDLTCEERPSESPFVERIWRSQSDRAVSFSSMAEIHSGIVITKVQGQTILTVRGPEIRATPAFGPADAEFIGIQFKPGTFMPKFPPNMTSDRRDVNLPEAAGNSFWLDGSAWQFFDFENADTFIERLVRAELLAHDPIAGAVLEGQTLYMSPRTVQRRFLQSTGLTFTAVRQIDRARYATLLLKGGLSILDTVYRAGYFDQPHLTRSLKQLTGQTPAQLIDPERAEPLSFLYKTDTLVLAYDSDVQPLTAKGA